MHLKEFSVMTFAFLIILLMVGQMVTLTATQREAPKILSRTALPIFWKYVEAETPFYSFYAFEYAMYKVGKEGGIMSASEYVEKMKNVISNFLNSIPLEKNLQGAMFDSNTESSVEHFASGSASIASIKMKVEVTTSGDITSVKLLEYNISSPLRIGYLYDKAQMFYHHVFEGKDIHCFSWDGNEKITITYHSLKGSSGRVHLHWKSSEASFISSTGTHKTVGDYEVVECTLGDKESCEIRISPKSKYITVYRTQPAEACFDLSCNEFNPTLIEKGKPYEVCIYTHELLPEKIRDAIENDKTLLPRKLTGSSSCSDTYYPGSGAQALADAICSGNKDNLINCIKERLKNKIQEILDEISERESQDSSKWELSVTISSANYEVPESYECSWDKCCKPKECSCKCESCESEGGEGGGGEGSSSTSMSAYSLFYPMVKYTEKSLEWNFEYKSPREVASEEDISPVSCPPDDDYDSCCVRTCHPPCNCKCGGGCVCTSCEHPTLHKWAYSYRYKYSYIIEVKIIDEESKIILAE
jgi:hypothetical protein